MISINGKTVRISSANSVSVINNKVFINGRECTEGEIPSGIDKIIVEGDVSNLRVDTGNIEIGGDVEGDVHLGTGNIRINGDVGGTPVTSCGNIQIQGNSK
jgi:hypothetical protein